MKHYYRGDKPTRFSDTSIERLSSCHLDLHTLFTSLAHDGWDITIVCGHRDCAAQTIAFESGNSEVNWPDSKHNSTPSMAVDAAPYIPGVGIPWDDPEPWYMLAGAVQAKAKQLDITVRWGGLFKTLVDLPHWELVNYTADDSKLNH
jgi:peptidoglycan L-alanyl-D-glutamate endopeptidase CwlK